MFLRQFLISVICGDLLTILHRLNGILCKSVYIHANPSFIFVFY